MLLLIQKIKKMAVSYKNYVCPNCWEQIQNCKCNSHPYKLINIDVLMQYAIRNLNLLRIKTYGCCEGHYYKNQIANIYINFREDSKMKGCPKGWKRSNETIYFYFYPKSKREFLTIQKEAIKNLNEWVNEIVNRY